MIDREQALARTPRHPIMLACFLIPWAAAIAYNAWERRGEILNWINARRLIPQRARPELDTLKARA